MPSTFRAGIMDLELLRTFVEVYRCRHFGKAAERLYITQSAVSARIRQLETSLGCQLLTRERKQVQPTADGERFLEHAENLLRQWARARRDMTQSASGGPPLRIGAVAALWEARAAGWLAAYQQANPAVRLRAESHAPAVLMPRLLEGALDIVMLFEAPHNADVEHRVIGELQLVLAATRPGMDMASALQSGYIALEWGSTFAAAQAEFLAGQPGAVQMDALPTALTWLRQQSGAAFVPQDVLHREEFLHPVDGAPTFIRQIHAIWVARVEVVDNIEQFLALAGREG